MSTKEKIIDGKKTMEIFDNVLKYYEDKKACRADLVHTAIKKTIKAVTPNFYQLKAENERLTQRLEFVKNNNEDLLAECKRTSDWGKDKEDQAKEYLHSLILEAEEKCKIKAENERLREALKDAKKLLKPFAAIAESASANLSRKDYESDFKGYDNAANFLEALEGK